jgi:hypothetical protein
MVGLSGAIGWVLSSGSPVEQTAAFHPLSVSLELPGIGWVDVSDDVTSDPIMSKRGYQSTAPDDVLAPPSTFSCTLDNSVANSAGLQGYYSPDSASALPGLACGIKVWYQSTTNGSTRTRFIGYVQRLDVTPGVYEAQTVTLTATSWLQLAATTRIAGLPSQILQRGDQLATTLVGIVEFPPPSLRFMALNDVYPYALWDLDPSTSTVMDGLISAMRSGLDRCHEEADGTLVIESRTLREMGSDTNDLELTDTAPSGHRYLAMTRLAAYRSLGAIYNHFTVTAHPGRVDLGPVVLYAYQQSGATTTIDPGQTLEITGQYVDPEQEAQYVGGFQMVDTGVGLPGQPANQLPPTDYEFRTAPDGLGDVITSGVAVGVAYESRQAVFTIVNSGTVTAYLWRLQCRGRGIYNYQDAVGRASAAGSLASQGELTGDIDCTYQPDPVFAHNAARYMVARYSTQQTQVDQGVQIFIPADAQADMDTLLGLEISAPIGISETVTALDPGDFWINGIQEEWDGMGNLLLTWFLARRDPELPWLLGVAGRGELGQTTILAHI